MKEPESDPKLHKDSEKEDNEVSNLDKVSKIALEQNETAPFSEAAVVQKEKDAFEGNSEASFIIETLGEKEATEAAYEKKVKDLKYKLQKHKNEEEVLLDTARRDYTGKLFLLTVSWLLIVVVFVFLTGLKLYRFNNLNCTDNCISFSLSDNVLIAFITSTTATVIGIFIVVAKWLFPSPNAKDNSDDKKKES